MNPQPQLPVGEVSSFNISEYETLKPYLISLVDLGDYSVSVGEGPC